MIPPLLKMLEALRRIEKMLYILRIMICQYNISELMASLFIWGFLEIRYKPTGFMKLY